MNFKFQWWNFNLTKLIYIAPMQLPPFRRRRMKVQRKNVVISQLFKSLTLVFTCILKCTFSANFQSHLYRMCWFYLNIASFIFFFFHPRFIPRTKFILGESGSMVMNFVLKFCGQEFLRKQNVFVVVHCGNTCNNMMYV